MHPPVNVRAAALGVFVGSGVTGSVDVDGVVSDVMRERAPKNSG